jgi:hypothetical protein
MTEFVSSFALTHALRPLDGTESDVGTSWICSGPDCYDGVCVAGSGPPSNPNHIHRDESRSYPYVREGPCDACIRENERDS